MSDLFTRSELNPILKPNPKHEWESLKVYNPGVVYDGGKYHMFYRAVGQGVDWHSVLGYATSKDGEMFESSASPILDRCEGVKQEYCGLEDPRVVKIGKKFYMAYAAYDGSVPRLSIATSTDLQNWERHGSALQNFDFFREGGVRTKWNNGMPIEIHESEDGSRYERSKAGGIFSEKINGKYWMFFNEFCIWCATSDDALHWKVLPGPFLKPRKNTHFFDNIFVEMGPPPIKTEKGWLVFYNGVNDAIQYQLGVLLLDLNDPTKILYRSDEPIFGPREPYELTGIVDIIPNVIKLIEQGKGVELKGLLKKAEAEGFMPQVTFVSAAVVVDGAVRLYYGAGDQYVCTATAPLNDILSFIS